MVLTCFISFSSFTIVMSILVMSFGSGVTGPMKNNYNSLIIIINGRNSQKNNDID